MELNGPAPDFELPDLESRRRRLWDQRGKIVIVNFWSCECPHSERTDREAMAICVRWRDDVVLLPVAANRIESAESMADAARLRRLPTVLIDREHVVADLYGALTTPEVFVIDRSGILRYHGAIDDVTFRQRRPTRVFLDEAVEALLNGRLPLVAETPPHGCAIVREAVE